MAPGLSAISQTSFSLAAILQSHQNTPPKIPNNGFFRSKTSSKNPSLSSSHSNTTHVSRAPALLEPAIYQTNNDPNSKICRLCDLGDLSMAMNLLSEASISKFQLDSNTYCSILQLCADHKSLSNGRKVHTILTSSGVEIDAVLGAKLVFMYVKCGDLREGRRVFDKIEKENVFVWNLVMNEHMKIGEFTESISLYKQMRESGVELNSYTFSCVLKCFAVLGGARDGERVHGHLLRLGYGSYNTVGNALIAFYAKCKKIESAYALFDEMLERDVISWNSMISGFVSNGLAERGVRIFSEMWFSGIRMDLITMVSVLPACAEMGFHRQARVLHGYAIKSGYAEEITFCNSLLDMYAKCSNLSNAVQVFERMSKRSVVSWTSMISGYARDGQFNKAIELFEEMEVEGIKPDLFTVTSILHACACNGSIEQGKGIHDHVMRNGLASNLSVANALMDMYAKCGSMEDARLVFDHMLTRDIISWNTMIGGYSKNSLPNEALGLFVKMQLESKPNGVTMACILPACASLSALEKGREIHGHILRNGFLSDGYIANALIDMYVKCGALALAHLLFDRMTMKDLVSWTVMIAGYGMHGHGKDAISVFNQMQDMGIKPDEVSFVAILYACSHSGLVDEGWRFFTIMRDDCKIVPKLEHYACIVDLLSRAGHLGRAYKFIESMPIEPDSTVWGALLCGCRTQRDVKLAEKVAEHVFELEPANTGYYILLANIYAEAEMWEAVKKIRERIGRRKLRKNPGCSWIEIKSRVNVFVAGDRSQPQSGKLQSFLETVRIRMKEEGYIPKKRYALLNGDDKEKEEALCGHSEKLAIAFGILNSPPGRSIRVTKNLRVCGDCHEVAKFMSKMVETEIVLRDSNRFHLFENGRCSCPNVRQLSAVLLRKKITGHWAKLSPHLRQSVKSALIDSITVEHSPLVRRASANVVSIIAKYAVPAGEWPDLLPFLFQCSQSPQEDHREVALILFSSLTETIGNAFQPHFTDLQSLLLKCLQDETSTRVRVAALKAVGSFLEFINDGAEVVKFREFIPSILNVSRQCLANGEEDVAAIAFEIFDELIESPAPLLGESVRSIVQFSLEVCSSQNLEINTRHQAIQIISWLAKYKANSLKKHKLAVPILQVMCPLLAESHGDEDDDLAADRAAAEVIDTMAVNLSKHVFPPVFEFSSLSIHSINPKFREASVTALGVISEGCFELMKSKLEPILHMVLGALKDQEEMVRGAASFALGQFAEHLQPEIISHYETVLPCILNALEDVSEEVKEKSYYALAAFCEDMGEEILPYIDPLMGRLLSALQSSPRNLQETCMSAIGSVAAAAEQAFIPYAEKVLELMKVFMVLTNDEDLRSRARATELVGIVAMAVGRTRMEPILPPFIEAAIAGFALDFSELREYTHGFFSNVAEIMDDGFTQYLPHVVPLAFTSCNLDDGSAVDIDESDGDDVINGFGGVSSDDESHDEPRVRNISIRTGVLDEKAAAIQAIGLFALHTKSSYAPYLEESLRILVRHAGYFHEDVRLQAIIGLKHILTATLAVPPNLNEEVGAKKKEVLGTFFSFKVLGTFKDD